MGDGAGGGPGEQGGAVRAADPAHGRGLAGGARAAVPGVVRGAGDDGVAGERGAGGRGRVIAVGTTAVRALESATGPDGVVRTAGGWTDLVVTPGRGVRAVDGLLTGLHEPGASHLMMLEAVAGAEAVRRGYAAARAGLCLWHECGDVHLLLKDEKRY
ncbi:S-adenosylmethionine:tRNA ribosyltransferase-isomerase [Streptomyces sp. Mg1]|nr:S-adenosylmethionine:tRNA ribosyltransferase-isomerase [Streptomyces sp. Mg1]